MDHTCLTKVFLIGLLANTCGPACDVVVGEVAGSDEVE